jgi:hypothetical protein
VARLIAASVAIGTLGAALGGCSELYFDRRDTIALSTGDAIGTNTALQTVDPWPQQSGNPNIAFNGQRMQAALERYRLGKVTTAIDSQQAPTNSQAQNVTQISVGSGSTPTAGTTGTPTVTASPGQ